MQLFHDFQIKKKIIDFMVLCNILHIGQIQQKDEFKKIFKVWLKNDWLEKLKHIKTDWNFVNIMLCRSIV